MLQLVTWTESLAAIGGVATPLIVLIIGILLATRQSRNQELLKARIEDFRRLIPDLNTLMCYMTFIGAWRDQSPPEIIGLKRRLDQRFYCAAPLFSSAVSDAYSMFLESCFATFGKWGEDALIRSGPFRRREAWRREDSKWRADWKSMFTRSESEAIPAFELQVIRVKYDELVVALADDLKLSRTSSSYTTSLVSLNAHAPRAREVEGDG